jgi:hypothetical protein
MSCKLCNIFVPNLEFRKILSMDVKLQDATNTNQFGLKSLSSKFNIITTKEKQPT